MPLPFKLIIVLLFIVFPAFSFGETINEIEGKIKTRNEEIEKLEKEIKIYEGELSKTGLEIKNLKGALAEIETTSKKLDTGVKLTERKIENSEAKIDELSNQIGDKNERIGKSREAIGSIIRAIDDAAGISPMEMLVSDRDFGDFWTEIDELALLEGDLKNHILGLKLLKGELESTKVVKEKEKKSLEEYKIDLVDQKEVVEYNKKLKNEILKETNNKDSNYRKLLAERKARRDGFEKELAQLESQLKIILNKDLLPQTGSRILSWPVDNPLITQEFGDTAFARANVGVYNGRGHNGIDLRASIGEPIKSAESGEVLGIGDTDLTCKGASYGKWALIRHSNGLTTLYAHFSVIRVRSGDMVSRSQVIGFAGNTGYSTGPHLHFTVYASQGVQIKEFKSKGCSGRTYILPVASYNSYLNPLLYL